MTETVDNILRNNMAVSVCDVKCRTAELSVVESAPNVGYEKLVSNRDNDVAGDIEQLEKKKTRRRRKTKRKAPYNKQISENRGKKNIRVRAGKSTYEQPVAPYNSNQFLIEDHNDLQDFDMKLMEAANKGSEQVNVNVGPARTGRVRDPSFTSADSDEDFFYSSPEDEEEFLTKEFSNTYQDLHVESLASMSKSELIQTILQLEDKVDTLQKRMGCQTVDSDQADDAGFQSEIATLVLANEKLTSENTKLRQVGTKCLSPSSEDSESDSTSSSASSDINSSDYDADRHRHPYKDINGDEHDENDINMLPTDT